MNWLQISGKASHEAEPTTRSLFPGRAYHLPICHRSLHNWNHVLPRSIAKQYQYREVSRAVPFIQHFRYFQWHRVVFDISIQEHQHIHASTSHALYTPPIKTYLKSRNFVPAELYERGHYHIDRAPTRTGPVRSGPAGPSRRRRA